MTLVRVAKRFEKVLEDNSPAILSGVAIVGTLTAAYLTGKATVKAVALIKEEEEHRVIYSVRTPLSNSDRFKIAWKEYIPAAGTGVLTVVCIIGANQIGTRRTAAMAAAYTISDKAFSEYRTKIVEKLGENKEQAARDEIAQERVARTRHEEIVFVGGGDVLCFDTYSARYFMSSKEDIRRAENNMNYILVHNDHCTLGDFYDEVGLESTAFSEEFGWTPDYLLDIKFSTVLSGDDKPALAITYDVTPIRKYNYFGLGDTNG